MIPAQKEDRPILALTGPTGTGKSELAQSLAESFGGYLINLDAMQLYDELLVGTARPFPESFRHVPHGLFGCLSPAERFSAGEYVRRAEDAIGEARRRGLAPILVGGTGLYLRALRFGLDAPPAGDDQLRERLHLMFRNRGQTYLARVLARLAPREAEKVDLHNPARVMRAIEKALAEGEGGAGNFPRGPARRDLQVVVLTDRRADLYARLDQRTGAMWEKGLIEETRALLDKYGPEAQALRAIGYRECAAFLAGTMSREAAVEKMAQATRRYAKRQWTWFRKEPGAWWITREEAAGPGFREAFFTPFLRP